MSDPLIAKFDSQKTVEDCVHALLREGVSKDSISLMTLADRNTEQSAKNPAFQKNGDVQSTTAAGVVGGTVGAALGSLAGLATIAVPGIGPLIAIGPVLGGLGGVAAGGALGNAIGAETERENASDSGNTHNLLHTYLRDLRDGEILLAVEDRNVDNGAILETIRKHASAVLN